MQRQAVRRVVRQAVGEEAACQPDAAAKLAVRRMAVEHADYECHPAAADIFGAREACQRFACVRAENILRVPSLACARQDSSASASPAVGIEMLMERQCILKKRMSAVHDLLQKIASSAVPIANIEFQERGLPHAHMLFKLHDRPADAAQYEDSADVD